MVVMQFGYSDGEQLYLSLSNSGLCRESFIYHSVSVYMCVCVCMDGCMYEYICVCVCVCMHLCMYVCIDK